MRTWNAHECCFVLAGIIFVLAIVVIGAGIINFFVARQECLEYEETYEVLHYVIENGTDLENAGLVSTAMKYNKWLIQANADKKMWGRLSKYYYCDLDNLEYMRVAD